jgi:hypothetical protein
MNFLVTLHHLVEARKIVAEGARDLAAQRKLVEKMEANGGVDDLDIFLLEQLEQMQRTYATHVNKLEYKLLEELRLENAEDA